MTAEIKGLDNHIMFLKKLKDKYCDAATLSTMSIIRHRMERNEASADEALQHALLEGGADL